MKTLLDLIAWVGAFQLILMYVLLSSDRIKPKKTYHFFNLTGAAFVCSVCLANRVWQAAVVEGLWTLFALFFFLRLLWLETDNSVKEINNQLEMYKGWDVREAIPEIKRFYPDFNVVSVSEFETTISYAGKNIVVIVNPKGLVLEAKI